MWNFLHLYIEEHDAAVFTTKEFIPPGLHLTSLVTMAPAICPLSSKNMFIEREVCRELAGNLGFDTRRLIITQVSRLTTGKTPSAL